MIQKISTGFVLLKTGFLTINTVEESINKTLALLSGKHELAQVCCLAPLCSEQQILHSLEQSIGFHAQNIGISSKLSLEFLVRVTASRQIQDALNKLALKSGKQAVVLVFFSSDKKRVEKAFQEFKELFEFKEKSGLIQKNLKENFSKLCKLYSISETELKTLNSKDKYSALQSLVLERIACLELN